MTLLNQKSNLNLSSQRREIFAPLARLNKLEILRLVLVIPASMLFFIFCLVAGLVSLDLYTQSFCTNKVDSVCYDNNWYVIENLFISFFASLYAFGVVLLNTHLAPRWKKQVCWLTFLVGSSFALVALYENPSVWPISVIAIVTGTTALKIALNSQLK